MDEIYNLLWAVPLGIFLTGLSLMLVCKLAQILGVE